MRIPIVTFLCWLMLATVKATSVKIEQEWKPDFGWEVTCHWSLDMDDRLLSVTLTRNKQQFFRFLPESLSDELRKTNTYDPPEAKLAVDCMSVVENGIKGRCVLTVEPVVPPNSDFTFGCTVSGERPYFKMAEDEKLIEALVPPSEAIMVVTRPESGPATVNCSSSGIPSPRIVWTVENQTVPYNFHKSTWNATSKLWDVWSTFTPPSGSAGKVLCTPEATKGSQQIRGQPVQYNNAFTIVLDGALLTIAGLVWTLLN